MARRTKPAESGCPVRRRKLLAGAELAQATTGSELGAPCDERQHFLVRGSAVGEYY